MTTPPLTAGPSAGASDTLATTGTSAGVIGAPPAAPAAPPSPSLVRFARALATDLSWLPRVRLSADGRWYERLNLDSVSAPGRGRDADVREDQAREAWLISWLPGQATGFHDHGGAWGAFAVALGSLQEHDLAGTRTFSTGEVRGFGARHVHDVRNTSTAPAVSVHVYSPPLSVMNRYDLTESGLVRLGQERAGDW
jgi:hypothetical protein